jgi:hypothetical protein
MIPERRGFVKETLFNVALFNGFNVYRSRFSKSRGGQP